MHTINVRLTLLQCDLNSVLRLSLEPVAQPLSRVSYPGALPFHFSRCFFLDGPREAYDAQIRPIRLLS